MIRDLHSVFEVWRPLLNWTEALLKLTGFFKLIVLCLFSFREGQKTIDVVAIFC